jgi:hypothetical protein
MEFVLYTIIGGICGYILNGISQIPALHKEVISLKEEIISLEEEITKLKK